MNGKWAHASQIDHPSYEGSTKTVGDDWDGTVAEWGLLRQIQVVVDMGLIEMDLRLQGNCWKQVELTELSQAKESSIHQKENYKGAVWALLR